MPLTLQPDMVSRKALAAGFDGTNGHVFTGGEFLEARPADFLSLTGAMRTLFFRREPCETFALRAQINSIFACSSQETPARRGFKAASSLEGIHGSSSRMAKSIGPSARPVPDDDHGMKR